MKTPETSVLEMYEDNMMDKISELQELVEAQKEHINSIYKQKANEYKENQTLLAEKEKRVDELTEAVTKLLRIFGSELDLKSFNEFKKLLKKGE